MCEGVELYLYSSCTSCKKAESLLKDERISFQRRDYFKDRFGTDELRALLHGVGLTAHDVLSTRATKYKEMSLDQRVLSEDELIALMVAEPTLLRRPLVKRGERAVVGFDRAGIEALVRLKTWMQCAILSWIPAASPASSPLVAC